LIHAIMNLMNDRPGRTDTIPDRWLRVFAAAASHESFTAAAAELGIGQPAVSHAVKRLESELGTPLFNRGSGGATLTAEGTRLSEEVGAAFGRLDAAVASVRQASQADRSVELSVSTSFATHWLLPRLPRFKHEHPQIELRCSTDDTDGDVGTDGADLWIPHGHGTWPGFERWLLARELIYPVAGPGLVADPSSVGLDDLAAQLPLLHLTERYRPRMDWATWLNESGWEGPPITHGARFSDYSLTLHAAMAGQGVALGWHHIVGPLVSSGSLVRLGDREVRTDRPFQILALADRTLSPAAAAMRDWLIAEVAAGN